MNKPKYLTKFMLVGIITIILTCLLPVSYPQAAKKLTNIKSVSIKNGGKTVTKKTISLTVGNETSLKVVVKPAKAKKRVSFKSSKPAVAKVSSKGKITAKKAGTSKITVTVQGKNGKKKKSYVKIKVNAKANEKPNVKPETIAVTSVTATVTKSELTTDETVQITASVFPANATDRKLTYSSSNDDVASVNQSGLVTAKKAGTAQITVKSSNGKSAVVTINVKDKVIINVPTIEKVRLINKQDIEIYWSEEVTGAGWVESKRVGSELVKQEQNFAVKVDGKVSDLYYGYWYYPEYDNYEIEEKGVVYYTQRDEEFYPNNPINPKTTLRLEEPITDLADLPEIKVTIKGNVIKGKTSNAFLPEQTVTVEKYEPFYTQERTLDCGVKVLGSAKVREAAMDKAQDMLKILLANETVAKRMGDAGCMLGLYGEGEIAYDIPEHRFDYDTDFLYVEGFGGTQLASIRDANVLRLKTGSYQTGYPDESILTHEFAHTVYNFGLSEEQQQEWLDIFNTSVAAGKWANSYAGSNKDEYFATLSAIWFNAMDDTHNGEWDGVRGPINTRAELKAYDEDAYNFLSKIYVPDQYLPSPWENGTVPDNYTYSGDK